MNTTAQVQDRPVADPHHHLACWAWPIGSAAVGTLVVWAVSRLGEVDLTVQSGTEVQTVGWVNVLVASIVAAALGTGLLRLLQQQMGTARGRKTWAAIAVPGLLLSILLGPLSATTGQGMITLSAMHVVVLVALAGSAWRR